jgi:hypothetical protein
MMNWLIPEMYRLMKKARHLRQASLQVNEGQDNLKLGIMA